MKVTIGKNEFSVLVKPITNKEVALIIIDAPITEVRGNGPTLHFQIQNAKENFVKQMDKISEKPIVFG